MLQKIQGEIGNNLCIYYLSMNPVEKLVVTYNRNAKNKTNFYFSCDKNQTIFDIKFNFLMSSKLMPRLDVMQNQMS